jgi:hypothetical protein
MIFILTPIIAQVKFLVTLSKPLLFPERNVYEAQYHRLDWWLPL